jgi:hypothetical protein
MHICGIAPAITLLNTIITTLGTNTPWRWSTFSLNLNQNVGTYDLFTATQDVVIDPQLSAWYVNAAATGLTSISVQSNQTTPYVWLSSAEGAIAALTAQATLSPAANSQFMLRGAKMQYSINTTNGTGGLILLEVAWRPGKTTPGSIA